MFPINIRRTTTLGVTVSHQEILKMSKLSSGENSSPLKLKRSLSMYSKVHTLSPVSTCSFSSLNLEFQPEAQLLHRTYEKDPMYHYFNLLCLCSSLFFMSQQQDNHCASGYHELPSGRLEEIQTSATHCEAVWRKLGFRLHQLALKDHGLFAVVLICRKEKHITIAVKGDPPSMLKHFRLSKAVFEPSLHCFIHKQFHQAASVLLHHLEKNQLIPSTSTTSLNSSHENSKWNFTLTGYAQGGSIACILGMMLFKKGFPIRDVITFGQDTITNAAGGRLWGEQNSFPLTRIDCNSGRTFFEENPNSNGFCQFGNEIKLPADGAWKKGQGKYRNRISNFVGKLRFHSKALAVWRNGRKKSRDVPSEVDFPLRVMKAKLGLQEICQSFSSSNSSTPYSEQDSPTKSFSFFNNPKGSSLNIFSSQQGDYFEELLYCMWKRTSVASGLHTSSVLKSNNRQEWNHWKSMQTTPFYMQLLQEQLELRQDLKFVSCHPLSISLGLLNERMTLFLNMKSQTVEKLCERTLRRAHSTK